MICRMNVGANRTDRGIVFHLLPVIYLSLINNYGVLWISAAAKFMGVKLDARITAMKPDKHMYFPLISPVEIHTIRFRLRLQERLAC